MGRQFLAGVQPSPFTAQAGEWQQPALFQSGAANNMTVNLLTAVPFDVGPKSVAYDALGYNVTTAAVGGSAVALRVGIYNDLGNGSGPGKLKVDLGQQTLASTGAKAISTAQTLEPGRYWLAAVWQYSTVPGTPPQVLCLTGNVSPSLAGAALGTNYRGRTATISAGAALPDPFPASTTANVNIILLGLRAA